MKLLMIGWDGATWDHVVKRQPSVFVRLKNRGVLLPEPLFQGTYIDSGNAWTTISTGVGFEKHSIVAFDRRLIDTRGLGYRVLRSVAVRQRLPSAVRRVILNRLMPRFCAPVGHDFPTSTDVKFKRMWEYVPGTSLIVGLPLTYPAFRTNAILVSGIPHPRWEAAAAPTVFPFELEAEVRKEFPGFHYTEGESPAESPRRANLDEYRMNVVQCTRQSARLFARLAESAQIEVGFVMLPLADSYLHVFDSDHDLDLVYRTLNEISEELVQVINPDHVLVLSDHGMMPTRRLDRGILMDHDTRQGIWASDLPLDLKTHLDVTPAVLRHFGLSFKPETIEREPPGRRGNHGGADDELLKEHLRRLGYL